VCHVSTLASSAFLVSAPTPMLLRPPAAARRATLRLAAVRGVGAPSRSRPLATWIRPGDPAPRAPPPETPFTPIPEMNPPLPGRYEEMPLRRRPTEVPPPNEAPPPPEAPPLMPPKPQPPEVPPPAEPAPPPGFPPEIAPPEEPGPTREPQMPITPLPKTPVPLVPPVPMPQAPPPEVAPAPMPQVTPREALDAAAASAQPELLGKARRSNADADTDAPLMA
jgi:hypothetical protein